MVGLMLALLFKSFLVFMPLTISWLAFRRLALSRTGNAWLYAASGLFGLVTAVGLLPWAIGFAGAHALFFVFAAFAPCLWLGVVTICNATRSITYDTGLDSALDTLTALLRRVRRKPAPLILEGADWPDAPKPVFRHAPVAGPTGTPEVTAFAEDPAEFHGPESLPESRARAKDPVPPMAAPETGQPEASAAHSLLSITREMRRNKTSEPRRIKLLPSPKMIEAGDLPFLRTTGRA